MKILLIVFAELSRSQLLMLTFLTIIAQSLKEQRLLDRLRSIRLAESKATPIFDSRRVLGLNF
ncbi:MAG: hypothetical protein QXU95_00525 [Candidatus Bathyarchaeia archaeon]|nr:hypothetical protein [Candidatus Bathyarchaeota archaeon]